jgi:hypothetical protein
MANTATNVVVGITGAVYVGATSATAPTATDSTLDGFADLGYVSADGVTVTPERSSTAIRSWQNADLIREVVTEGKLTYKFMLLESNADVLEAYFGAPLDGGKISWTPTETGGRKSFVVDVIDGDSIIRHYIPAGEVMVTEAQTVKNGEAVGYGITITAYIESGRAADVFFSAFE